jgi:hypothetical protein
MKQLGYDNRHVVGSPITYKANGCLKAMIRVTMKIKGLKRTRMMILHCIPSGMQLRLIVPVVG